MLAKGRGAGAVAGTMGPRLKPLGPVLFSPVPNFGIESRTFPASSKDGVVCVVILIFGGGVDGGGREGRGGRCLLSRLFFPLPLQRLEVRGQELDEGSHQGGDYKYLE